MTQPGAEVLFYHLEGRSLDQVLPALIEKTLQRGWKAIIQAGHKERVDAIDQLLWTYRDDSFIPHASAKSGKAELQPVFITETDENPNGAAVRFLVAGAQLGSPVKQLAEYIRIVLIFDGNDDHELTQARATWKTLRPLGANATYWQQTNSGGWEKKA